uniref:phenylalanine--tRNA ligase n=1 Tax=Melanthalia intermedia TaxID=172989 RepID=A0A345UAZ3_9FLOR|nr:phenylalanine-tRNA ligase beta subunit [Melanthalia intermedia]AXI97629.1 phenylalanine-tRNA ligase beta subunit [Melanthalia intermedia]
MHNIKSYELIDKLIFAGFEVNSVVYNTEIGDLVLELNAAGNRFDVLSLLGLAREISSLLNRPLINSAHKAGLFCSYFKLNTSNELYFCSNTALLDIVIVHIVGTKNSSSPIWLQNYLAINNVKSLSLFNDIPKYICMKWGQDVAIFDKKKIDLFPLQYSFFHAEKQSLAVSSPNNLSTPLDIELQILKYKNKSLSAIGFDISRDAICNLNTNSVIVCGQICSSKYVNSIQNKMSSRTEIFNRHSRSISRCDFTAAYQETVQLIVSFAGGTIGKPYSWNQPYCSAKNIILKQNRIHDILGPVVRNGSPKFLSVQEILALLMQLGFFANYIEVRDYFVVQVPLNRQQDLQRPIDIIEEIGRIYGFGKFVSRLSSFSANLSLSCSSAIKKNQKVRRILRELGLNEMLTYSFANSLNTYNASQITLCNPITEDQLCLRDNLAVQLVKVQEYNLKHGFRDIQIFEIGRVFKNTRSVSTPYFGIEHCHVAGLISNSAFLRKSWCEQSYALGWFQAKGILEEFFEKLHVEVAWFKLFKSGKSSLFTATQKLLSLTQSASIYDKASNQEIGVFGQLKSSNLYSAYLFELNLVSLTNASKIPNHRNYSIYPYSTYPALIRDISLTLKQSNSVWSVKKQIFSFNNPLIESVEVLDEYINYKLKHAKKVTFRIAYRSQTRTLNYQDIRNIDMQLSKLLDYYAFQVK